MLNSLKFNYPFCKSSWKTMIWLMTILLLLVITGCSKRPRDEYAQELLTGIDKVHAALEQYRANPSGKSSEPVDMTINGKSARLTGSTALLVSQSYAEMVAGKTKVFWEQFQTLKFPVFMDIQSDKGYDKWATATNKKLREKADKCLTIIAQVKSDYKADPESIAFKSFFIGRPYPTVRITPEDELIFAANMQEGIVIERILKVDFRKILDGIHNQESQANK